MAQVKEPQDRKPKQAKKQPAPSPAVAGAGGLTEVDREVVSIGLDFRPIPVNMGDGRIWEFLPDPSADQWATVEAAMKAFRAISEDDDDALVKASAALHGLTDAVANLLTADSDDFVASGYGPFALQRLATKLMETITGFPTGA